MDPTNTVPYDILRDVAPDLCARLHADHGRNKPGLGRELIEQYNQLLTRDTALFDPEQVSDDVKALNASMMTLRGHTFLLRRLSTYEIDHTRAARLKQDPTGLTEDPLEHAREEAALDILLPARESLTNKLRETGLFFHRLIDGLSSPRTLSYSIQLSEFDDVLGELKESLDEYKQALEELRSQPDLYSADMAVNMHRMETQAFLFEVVRDTDLLVDQMRKDLGKFYRKGNERNDTDGPRPVGESIGHIAANLGVETPKGRGSFATREEKPVLRKGFSTSKERVDEAVEGGEVVSIKFGETTRSFRDRMAERAKKSNGSPGNGTPGG